MNECIVVYHTIQYTTQPTKKNSQVTHNQQDLILYEMPRVFLMQHSYRALAGGGIKLHSVA